MVKRCIWCLLLTMISGCHFDKHCTPRDDHKPLPPEAGQWAVFKEGEMMVFKNASGILDTCFYGPWIQQEYFEDCTNEGKDCCVRNYETSLINKSSHAKNKRFSDISIELNPPLNTEDLVIHSTGIASKLNFVPTDSCPMLTTNDCIRYYSIIYSKSKGLLQFADYDENKNIVLWKRVF